MLTVPFEGLAQCPATTRGDEAGQRVHAALPDLNQIAIDYSAGVSKQHAYAPQGPGSYMLKHNNPIRQANSIFCTCLAKR